jgi:hypothetical protein
MAKRKANGPAAPAEKSAAVVKTRTLSIPTEEQIRLRAYQIYLDRGGRPGSPEADWFQAETELKLNGQPGAGSGAREPRRPAPLT